MMLQRDVFIDFIHKQAKTDKDIVFLSADFGAEALDPFRKELPKQFIHCGISEQHMIDMAAGLSLSGKKVYVYCMGPFLSLRCIEQIKCSLAMMDRPVTMIGAGIGLGYADSGPTHYATEDLACLRAISGIEVLTPSDNPTTVAIAEKTLTDPKLRYIRLDREPLMSFFERDISRAMKDVNEGYSVMAEGTNTCIFSSGYMLHRVMEAHTKLAEQGIRIGVIDLFRIKPINKELLLEICNYEAAVTVEEQCLSGGFGSAVAEFVTDNKMLTLPMHRIGLPDRYYFENGGRKHLLDSYGLSVDNIISTVVNFERQIG